MNEFCNALLKSFNILFIKAWLPPLLQVMIDMNKVKKVLGINQVKIIR